MNKDYNAPLTFKITVVFTDVVSQEERDMLIKEFKDNIRGIEAGNYCGGGLIDVGSIATLTVVSHEDKTILIETIDDDI